MKAKKRLECNRNRWSSYIKRYYSEGLSVSYFLRIAKTPVSDTLTQMGRWFGYRHGYEDLYRIYVPKILHILFRQFTYAMEFAREKFREMQTSEPPKTPIEFSMEIYDF